MASRLLLVGCLITACVSGVHAQLPTDESLARHGLSRRWYAHAPIDGARESVQRVTLIEDQIHMQTNASRIHVFETETGRLLWSAQMGRALPGQFGSAVNSNSVFVVNGSYLYRLDRGTGGQLWSQRLPESPSTAPVADEERVVVCTRNGRIYVYHVDTKELLWFYQTNETVSVPAAILDEKIVAASEDGKMYVFQTTSRNPTLRYNTDAPVSAPLAVSARTVFLPSQDYNVYAVDVRTGNTQWRYASGSEIHRPLTVIENDLFVHPDDQGMHVVDVATGPVQGRPKWSHPRAEDFIAASRDKVYAADRYGQLLILDRSNGRQLGVADIRQFALRARNDTNDRIILVSRSGLMVCVHETSNDKPLVHERPQAPSPLDALRPGAPRGTN